ncbi:hypothetical protein EN981_15645, partial [Mesorhizobium sp. M7A.F.Ca.CA.001.13.2.1]
MREQVRSTIALVCRRHGSLGEGGKTLNVAASTIVGSRHFLFRIRFQLLGGLTFAIFAPAIIRIVFN